jgi:hypothetical protein
MHAHTFRPTCSDGDEACRTPIEGSTWWLPSGSRNGSSSSGVTVTAGDGSRCCCRAGAVSLADARCPGGECRAVLAQGGDPIDLRREQPGGAAAGSDLRRVRGPLHEAHRSSWRNEKHAAQWQTTLTTYAEPIRNKPVDEVTREDVLAILRPIWTTKNETASRLRGRIEVYWMLPRPRVCDRGEPCGLEGKPETLTSEAPEAPARSPRGYAIREGPRIRSILAAGGRHSGASIEFLILTAAEAERSWVLAGASRLATGSLDSASGSHESRTRASGAALQPSHVDPGGDDSPSRSGGRLRVP